MTMLKLLIVLFSLISFASHAVELDKIKERDFIQFAVYDNFPPYSYKNEKGRIAGVDVDIARAIGKQLNVQVGFRLFTADESVEDDLRNVVWKGHYLAGDPADVMLHAPYDVNFAKSNDKVIFSGPYYREVVAFAIDTIRLAGVNDLKIFAREPIGVETATISDAYLLGAYGGQLRNNVRHYKTVSDAVAAMMIAEIPAVMANRGELEFNLARHQHDFVIAKIPTPGLNMEGWELSAAVSAEYPELAYQIDKIIKQLRASGEIEAIFKAHGLSYQKPFSSKLLAH